MVGGVTIIVGGVTIIVGGVTIIVSGVTIILGGVCRLWVGSVVYGWCFPLCGQSQRWGLDMGASDWWSSFEGFSTLVGIRFLWMSIALSLKNSKSKSNRAIFFNNSNLVNL